MEQQPLSHDNSSIASPEHLKKVVDELDMKFIKMVAACEPDECIKRLISSEGNIFHFAASQKSAEFFTDVAITILPPPVVQSLLCQKGNDERNPLHIAANNDRYKTVKLILDFYRSSSTSSSNAQSVDKSNVIKPWLQVDCRQCSPLHYGLIRGRELIALEILSMDVVSLSSMEDKEGRSPLYLALKRGLNRVALQILTSAPNCSLRGKCGRTALSTAPACSEQIFKLVLEKDPQLIIGEKMLHSWVEIGKLYPFEYVLNSNVIAIAPHLREEFIDQLSTIEEEFGHNPLHAIGWSDNYDVPCVKMAQVLVDAYKQERAELVSSAGFQPPWLVKNRSGSTPLRIAIQSRRDKLASYFFSLDKIKYLLDDGKLLLLAISYSCRQVAEEILDIVVQDARFMQLLTLDCGRNALHYAPRCTESSLRQLLETHPEFIKGKDEDGLTVLHSWIEIGELWPFEYVLKRDDIKPQDKNTFIDLLLVSDDKRRNTLHLAAMSSSREGMADIAKLLVDACSSEYFIGPWLNRDENGNNPIEVAVLNRSEEFALLFLSRVKDMHVVKEDLLFTAMEHKCHQVVKFLLERSYKDGSMGFLVSNKQNVLHLAWKSTKENGKLIVENWPGLIIENDEHGNKPLDKASEAGKAWLVELILQKDRTSILEAPLAWVKACKNGHTSTVLAFVDNSPYFRHICHEHQETPLHQLQKASYKEYRKLLEHPSINELKSTKNKDGETPLHRAIKCENKNLVEVLLSTDGVDWSIRDNNDKTAMNLLKEATMCKTIGVDPKYETTYIQVKTNLEQMQQTISMVAALLATITFTAGFTVPGGFNSDNGVAILTKKASFLAFLIADTYAMCCAMLILFCVIWSMVCNRSRSSSLLDRSLELLKHSLYGTLLAFMTGVYSVTHTKSSWAAILVIIMCSLVVILAQRRSLYEALDIVNFLADKEHQVKKQLISYWKRQAPIIKRFFKRKEVNAQDAASKAENRTNDAENGGASPAV